MNKAWAWFKSQGGPAPGSGTNIVNVSYKLCRRSTPAQELYTRFVALHDTQSLMCSFTINDIAAINTGSLSYGCVSLPKGDLFKVHDGAANLISPLASLAAPKGSRSQLTARHISSAIRAVAKESQPPPSGDAATATLAPLVRRFRELHEALSVSWENHHVATNDTPTTPTPVPTLARVLLDSVGLTKDRCDVTAPADVAVIVAVAEAGASGWAVEVMVDAVHAACKLSRTAVMHLADVACRGESATTARVLRAAGSDSASRTTQAQSHEAAGGAGYGSGTGGSYYDDAPNTTTGSGSGSMWGGDEEAARSTVESEADRAAKEGGFAAQEGKRLLENMGVSPWELMKVCAKNPGLVALLQDPEVQRSAKEMQTAHSRGDTATLQRIMGNPKMAELGRSLQTALASVKKN